MRPGRAARLRAGTFGRVVAAFHLPDLRTIDDHVARRDESQSDLVAPEFADSEDDIVTDHDFLSYETR
jgi:putative methionine-R-sulfoxide reductase with GAF domain